MKAKHMFVKGWKAGAVVLATGLTAALATAGMGPVSVAAPDVPVYQDHANYSFEERAADLVSRMTVDEKIHQLDDKPPAIARLGLAAYDYWNEALHGVVASGTTMFPSPTAIASTWNRGLVATLGTVISDEARVLNNVQNKGLTYWSPTLNIARDPRWGRADESYGEDPYLVGQIGAEFVKGVQGNDAKYLKAISTPKHFFANNSESNRRNGDSVVTERELREYYTPAFAHALSPEVGAYSYMTAYNRVNGVPMSASVEYLQTLVQRTWGFNGYVTTDCSAVQDAYNRHLWVPEGWDHNVTPAEGVAWTLKAGSDIDCQGNSYEQNMQAAYDSGLVTDADLDSELTNLLTGRFRLGEFDPADQVPYRSSEYSNAKMASAENQAASLAVSEEAPVLLKNDFIGGNGGSSQRGLPLTAEDAENIVVIGYLADEFTSGGYSGYGPVDSRTMIQGIETAAKQANPNASVEYLGDGVTPTMTMGEVCYPPWGCFPSAAWSGKPGVQGITFRDGATDLKSIAPPVNGYPASVSDNPAPDQFIFWEGWMGISWGGTYFGASSVWGGYAAIKADIPAAADALCLTQSGSTGEAPAAGIFEVHLDALDGPVVATIPAEGAASTCGVAGSDGAYSGPTGVHTLYVAYNPGTLGDFGQEGTAGHPWALAFDDTNVPSSDGIVEKIENASAVIVAVGTTNAESAEEMDRVNIDLPRFQDQLVAKVAAHNPRTVAWVQSVGQMDIEAFRNNVNVPSIVWSNYNGQHQGITAGNILFGKVNPSGKLPLTWYSDLDQLGTVWDYGITPTNGSRGRTYEYFTGAVSYPFGHGLSYSNFQYSNLKLDRQSLTADGAVTASVTVTNSSSVPGKETVELYVTAPGADGIALPKRQLKGFEKVSLGAFASTTVSIEVKAQDLWFWDEDAAKATWPLGTWNIQVGPKAGSGPVASFQLTDQPVLALDVVKAIPDGAVLNTAAPKTVIHSNLSASRSDQSFFDLADPAVQVSFASADPAVATVDQRGVVAPAGEGVTTITATVTAAGSTKSDSYAVVVEGADADPVVNVADQVVQLSQAASIPLGAQLALVPAGAATSVSYLIAGMDENTAGATVDPTSGVVTATQPGKVRVTVLADIDGVKLSQAAEITVVADQAAPVAQITAPAAPGSGAYTAPVELDIAGQWGSYTVYPTVEVSIDGGAWQVVTGPVRIAGDGEHTVSARVTDELGQVSPTTTATVKIDTSAPSLGAVTAVAADGVLTLTSADPDVAGFEYSPDGVNWKAYTAPLKITGWIYYRAVDAAGNRGPSDFVSVPAPAAQTPSAKPGDTPAAPKTLKSAKPKIKGTAKVGKKLKAVKGTWTAGAAVKFQWYAGSKAIKGATKASLTLKKAQAGKKIRVKATGTKTGYKSKSVTSKATKKVKK